MPVCVKSGAVRMSFWRQVSFTFMQEGKMEHDEKLSYFFEDLKRLCINRLNAYLLSYRLMRKLGFKLTPPHFAKFSEVFVHMAVFWAIFYGTVSWFLIWRTKEIAVSNFSLMIFSSAVASGLLIAFFYRRKA